MDAPEVPQLFREDLLRQRDFHEDFHDSLASCRSEYAGEFCYTSTDSCAPNPGIKIPTDDNDVQTVKLPWSWPKTRMPTEDDELDYRKVYKNGLRVSFSNPMWETYIEDKVREVARTLGVPPYFPKVQCDFRALIFHNPHSGSGFKFPDGSDSNEPNVVIGTMFVILPSAFDGGQAHFCHSGRTKVLDVSKGSEYGTSILAWPTGVAIKAQPFTSGSPLVLSYCLSYVPDPNAPLHNLPRDFRCQSNLEEHLIAWKEGRFRETLPKLPMLVYVLSFKYSAEDLQKGLEVLKDSDANITSHAICAAGRAGFRVCLGSLTKSVKTYKISGKRHWPWNMGFKNLDEEYKHWDQRDGYGVTNLVYVDGGKDGLFDEGVEVGMENVVPTGAFDGSQHDDLEHDKRFSTYYGDKRILQQHQRSALILLQQEDELSLGLALNGYEWALREISTLTAEHGYSEAVQTIVASLLKRLVTFEKSSSPDHLHELPSFDDNARNQLTRELGAYALKWRLPELWNGVIRHCKPSLEATVNSASLAITTFDLESIKPGLSHLLKCMPSLRDKLSLITSIAGKNWGTEGDWAGHLRVEALRLCGPPTLDDIPALTDIFRGQELDAHESSYFDRTLSSSSYDILINLAKALRGHHSSQPSIADEERARLDALIHRCIEASFPLWNKFRRNEYNTEDTARKRIHALVDFCLVELLDVDLCVTFASVVQNGATYYNYITLADALHQAMSRVPSSSHIRELGKTKRLRGVMGDCLSAATQQVDWSGSYHNSAQGRTDLFVQLSLNAAKPELCRSFLDSMKSASYSIHLSLDLSLQAQLKKIPQSDFVTTATLDGIRRSIFERITGKWDDEPMLQVQYKKGTKFEINRWMVRIDYILRWALCSKEPEVCVSLLNSVLGIPSKVGYKSWHSFYRRLLSWMTRSLPKKYNIAVTAEPFKRFFRLALSIYLARVLGPNTPKVLPSEAPKRAVLVGCDECDNCRQLQVWVNKDDKTPFRISAVQKVRTHVSQEVSLAEIDDIISMETVRESSPHTLVITKTHETVARMDWSETQSNARSYLQCFGFSEEELEDVMGERYEDVEKALQGEKVFVMTERLVMSTEAAKKSALFSNSALPSTMNTTDSGKLPVPKNTVAGVKRKHIDDNK